MQTNFKEFMKDCHASLILPENALIIARKTSSVVVANPVSRLADDPDAIVALGPVTVIAGQDTPAPSCSRPRQENQGFAY